MKAILLPLLFSILGCVRDTTYTQSISPGITVTEIITVRGDDTLLVEDVR